MFLNPIYYDSMVSLARIKFNHDTHLISDRKRSGGPASMGERPATGERDLRYRSMKPCSPCPSNVDLKARTIKIYLILVNYGMFTNFNDLIDLPFGYSLNNIDPL